MNKQQSGFTLIELVVVIVILGILGVAATAKFQDLAGEARDSAIQGVAGEIASASAINYAKIASGTTAGTGGTVQLNAANVCTAAILGGLVQGSGVLGASPNRYAVGGTGDCATAGAGGTVTCTLTDNADNTYTTNVSVICTN